MEPDLEKVVETYHEYLLYRAWRASRTLARSYRGFHVGASVLAYSEHVGAVFYKDGGNWKTHERGHTVCAEPFAIHAAIAEGATYILAIAISGKPQPDPDSKLETRTLHPCGKCRSMLSAMPEIRPDTFVFTFPNDDEGGNVETHTWEEILSLHAHEDPSGARWSENSVWWKNGSPEDFGIDDPLDPRSDAFERWLHTRQRP